MSWQTPILFLMDASYLCVLLLVLCQFPKEKRGPPMVTSKQAWVGFVILFLVVLLVVVATVYWQHVTGISALHVLADANGSVPQGC